MAERPLSAIPYYGGKYKMSSFLADILDYQNTDTFVTPFGGGARVLLNKPRHQREIYMEINPSVGSLFKVLSDYDKARVLLDRIYNETDVSKKCFDYHMHIKNEYENQMSRVVVEELIKGVRAFKKNHGLDNSVDYAFNNAFDGIVRGNLGFIDLNEILGEAFTNLPNTDQEKRNLLRLEENINVCIKCFQDINSYDRYTYVDSSKDEGEDFKFLLRFYEKLDDEISRINEEMKDAIAEDKISQNQIRKWIVDKWIQDLSLPEGFRKYDERVYEAAVRYDLPYKKVIEMLMTRSGEIESVGSWYEFEYDPAKDFYSLHEIGRFVEILSKSHGISESDVKRKLIEIQDLRSEAIEIRRAIKEELKKEESSGVAEEETREEETRAEETKAEETKAEEGLDIITEYEIKLDKINKALKKYTSDLRRASTLLHNYVRDMYRDNFYNSIDIPNIKKFTRDIDLALAAFVIFTQSRDGIGAEWNEARTEKKAGYFDRITTLTKVVERLEGVEVFIGDSLQYAEEIYNYFDDERAMVYCDPPYLKDKGVDHDFADNDLVEYNPGLVYKNGWTYANHIMFLNKARDAKCKLLISNYDDKSHLYDSILCGEGSPWTKIEYVTKTSIPKTGNKTRIECLWKNY
jgi:site-specific DNA-adenine methylase